MDAHSYFHRDPLRVLVDQEKEIEDKYLAHCHELHKDFTPMVYCIDGMAGREANILEK